MSGSGIIFTKDVVTTLCDNFSKYYSNVNIVNDVLIGIILLKNNIYTQDIKYTDLLYNDNIDNDIVNTDNKDICHYRIKHVSQYRLKYDTIVMNKLYDYYYKNKQQICESIDKIIYINLERRKDRKEKIEKQLD